MASLFWIALCGRPSAEFLNGKSSKAGGGANRSGFFLARGYGVFFIESLNFDLVFIRGCLRLKASHYSKFDIPYAIFV